jgi:hypothetical protein
MDIPDAVDIAHIVAALSEEFDQRCMERHEFGQEKYGAGTFLMVDTMAMALEEVVDLANYARYTYIRLRLLNDSIDRQVQAAKQPPEQTGFISNAKIHGGSQQ